MYLKNVRVRNVRGFRGAREVDLDLTRPDGSYAGWTVLAGRNGSGKSTLLRAVALAVSGPSAARGLVTGFDCGSATSDRRLWRRCVCTRTRRRTGLPPGGRRPACSGRVCSGPRRTPPSRPDGMHSRP